MAVLAWISDSHLDHASAAASESLQHQLRGTDGDVVVLTGDASVAPRLATDLAWIARAAARPLYFVLGNHDHYGGSVAAVRDTVLALSAREPSIQWLPPAGVVSLTNDTVLVGVDGWADGRHGNALTTRFVLNDDRLIAELARADSRRGKVAVKQALADADAGRLGVLLGRAVEAARHIVIATHVPPFTEAIPSTGHLADPDWRPLLVCGAVGSVIKRIAAEHPGHSFHVLCGHTHIATDVQVAANVRCTVAGASYGEPAVTTISL